MPLRQAILVAATAAACLAGCGDDPSGPKHRRPLRQPAGVYEHLRGMALDGARLDLPTRASGHPDVVGVVIDVPEEGGLATLVAMKDGATSLYTSVGGGVIGGGEHARVARANDHLLDVAQAELPAFEADDSRAHPADGTVRVFVVTKTARRVADIRERDFWNPSGGQLAGLVEAAQAVLTELRKVGA